LTIGLNKHILLISSNTYSKEEIMEQQYVCQVCGHVHDEAEHGKFEDLSDNFICPECGCFKDEYVIM
jgi:rubredoxin